MMQDISLRLFQACSICAISRMLNIRILNESDLRHKLKLPSLHSDLFSSGQSFNGELSNLEAIVLDKMHDLFS